MPAEPPQQPDPNDPRPSLGVFFKCANKYLRVYRSADGTRYNARCPTCGKVVRFVVGAQGTSQRTFEVDCGA